MKKSKYTVVYQVKGEKREEQKQSEEEEKQQLLKQLNPKSKSFRPKKEREFQTRKQRKKKVGNYNQIPSISFTIDKNTDYELLKLEIQTAFIINKKYSVEMKTKTEIIKLIEFANHMFSQISNIHQITTDNLQHQKADEQFYLIMFSKGNPSASLDMTKQGNKKKLNKEFINQIDKLKLFDILTDKNLTHFIEQQFLQEMTNIFPNILIGDVGGTNVRLILTQYDHQSKKVDHITDQKNFESLNYNSFYDIIQDFAKQHQNEFQNIKYAVFAVPGQVVNGKIELANLKKWGVIGSSVIETQFQIEQVLIINDSECLTTGIAHLNPITLKQINPEYHEIFKLEKANSQLKLIVTPGTGLGVSLIQCQQNDFEIFSMEHGHATFTPDNIRQRKLVEFLMYKLYHIIYIPNIISQSDPQQQQLDNIWTEQLIACPGLSRIANFIQQTDPKFRDQQNDYLKMTPKEICEKGLTNQDMICTQALEFYTELIGSDCSNQAIRLIPKGGIFLCGVLIKQLSQELSNPNGLQQIFLKHYYNKRKVIQDIIKNIPIYLIDDDNLGMKGAIALVESMFNQQQSQ